MKKSAAASGKAKPAAKRKKVASNSHPLAKPLPEGMILRDMMKGEWKIGKPIGSGGFGLLYLADKNSSATVSSSAQYVIKVEPLGNGPLFCELHFYQRAAKPDAIREWMSSHKVSSLGVPRFIATGQHDVNDCQFRFLVMERFGDDLQKLFERAGKRFSTSTVFLLGLKLLDVLEYIHDKEYVHADIKASNLLVGYTDPKQVYLVDYGLAYRYMADGVQKPYKEDPKRTHDGTIEFTSRDAHRGVLPSCRGDLEILGYCMLQWLCGQLPWEDKLTDKNYVRDQKMRCMADIPALMRQCFPDSKNIPVTDLSAYLKHVVSLGYNDRPDYQHCRGLFTKALKSVGAKASDKLDFGPAPVAKTTTTAGSRKRSVSDASPAARSRSPRAGSPELPLSSDEDDVAFTARSPKIQRKKETKKAPAGGRKKIAPAATAASAVPSPVTVAKLANGMAKMPLASARLPQPRKPASASETTAGPASQTAGNRGRETTIMKRRRNRVVEVATTSTQTTPGLDRLQ